MSDSLADGAGNPTQAQIRLYERWSEGGTAISFIGEVQGDPRYPEKPGNLVLDPHSDTGLLQRLNQRGQSNDTHLWPQLGHAGALTHPPVGKPKGPSPLDLPGLRCEGMSVAEIEELPQLYARSARLAQSVGFSGVHVHAGHGFLLSQFLSPLFNHRSDGYGGSIEARCRVLLEIIKAVRAAVGPGFPVGMRINSSDQLEGGLTESDALEALRMLDRSPLDLIDISGGTYFPGAKARSESASSGPYFLEFAKRAREVTRLPLMLTGGFKTRDQALGALTTGAVDVVGLGRAMALDPALPNRWLSDCSADPDYPVFSKSVAGGVTAWYTMRLTALGEDREQDFDLDLPTALAEYEARDEARCVSWNRRFSPF